eukprot:TRINITY_DN16816_c0_g1_i5.p1 TRINITY_DN16816_c0_g1~~TRINITY_DN16816_c0_g1_i5.p1  ORF type:complete len:148 (+),score=28.98 TRINITY_DN16816_c0_g1_i5:191-634(+)
MPFVEGEDSEEDEEEIQPTMPQAEEPEVPAGIELPTLDGAAVHSNLPLLSTTVMAPGTGSVVPQTASDSPAYADPSTPMQHRLRERNNGFRMALGRRLEQVLGGIRHDMNSCAKTSAGDLETLQVSQGECGYELGVGHESSGAELEQ